MKAKITPEQTAANIARVIELRQAGKTRTQILEITQFPDRFIRQHMKDVEVLAKPAKVTQLSVAAAKAYALAIRPQGCKDYELRAIAHEVYGTGFNADKNITTNNWNKDTLYNIKKRVNEMAAGELIDGEPVNPQFVMDWVCDERPAQSRIALEQGALELAARFDEMLTEFLCEFLVDPESDELALTEAQAKQRYAARRHMLKLAFPEFVNGEPLSTLLARSEAQTDALESTQDLPATPTPIKYFEASPIDADSFAEDFVDVADVSAVTDTGSLDPFFDESDIFANVAVATSQQIVYTKAVQSSRAVDVTDSVQDDVLCGDELVDTDDEFRYSAAPEIEHFLKGFDIAKYTGVKKNVTGIDGSELLG